VEDGAFGAQLYSATETQLVNFAQPSINARPEATVVLEVEVQLGMLTIGESKGSDQVEVLGLGCLRRLGQGAVPARFLRLDGALAMPAEQRVFWERRLNRLRRSCGCAEGAVGLLLGVLLVTVAAHLSNEPWTATRALAALGVPITLLVVGKLAGRSIGRLRFRRACSALVLQISSRF